MLFNSAVFIFAFLPVAVLVFYLLRSRTDSQGAYLWLVLASLFFYGWWDPRYLALIMLSTTLNYLLGARIGGLAPDDPTRRRLLVLGVTGNLASIGYFKYTGLFLSTTASLLDRDWTLPEIVLPLGISFFTFQQIAFLVDAYRGETRELNFVRYALFVTFFPQLIAGPIVHHKEMLPQFASTHRRRFSADKLAIGTTIFAIGLFKKVVIADGIAVYASPVFAVADGGGSLQFLEAWGGALAYTFQLYFDFSGYSDMAIGLGRLFGVRLPQNFHSPYRCASIVEFWRCWHMTLSRFLSQYLYIPLGGNRKGRPRRYLNLMITMLLGGLWHGAGWNFVLWGGLHGFYLVVNHGWRHLWSGRGRPPWTAHPLLRVFPWSITFLSVVVAWVFFRATTFEGALVMIRAMFGIGGLELPASYASKLGPLSGPLQSLGVEFAGDPPLFFGGPQVAALGLLLLWVTLLPNTCELMRRYRPAIGFLSTREPWRLGVHWRLAPAWAGLAAALLLVSVTRLTQVSEFLYFQF